MKKLVRVIVEKEFEIEIPDASLTDENIKAFEGDMWVLDNHGDDRESKIMELFENAGYHAFNDFSFVEGLGPIGPEYRKERSENPDAFITVKEVSSDIEYAVDMYDRNE